MDAHKIYDLTFVNF